jgi:hypothetical protein
MDRKIKVTGTLGRNFWTGLLRVTGTLGQEVQGDRNFREELLDRKLRLKGT